MKFLTNIDWGIFVPSVLIISISLIVLSSLDVGLFKNQLVYSVASILLFFLFSSVQIHSFKNSRVVLYIVSIILLLIIFVTGLSVRGSQRWLDIFGFRLQFSEIVKPFLIVCFASLLASWRGIITLKRFLIGWLLFFPIVFLIFKQPDLGNAIIYSITFLLLFFFGGLSGWYFVVGIGIFTIISPLIWKVLHDYQRNRIISFLNPNYDPLGIGYHVIQSTIAVGSGILFGRGLGRGGQSQLQFLPERHTDFIFATYSEEFGFVGSLVLLVLYFSLLVRILQIAKQANDEVESLTAYGIFALILAQAFINIGMNVGIMPVTGVTLPLFSYGGSSLVSTMIMLGFVNSLATKLSYNKQILEIR